MPRIPVPQGQTPQEFAGGLEDSLTALGGSYIAPKVGPSPGTAREIYDAVQGLSKRGWFQRMLPATGTHDIASYLAQNTPSMSEVPPDMVPADVITQTEAMAEMFDRHMRRQQAESAYMSGPEAWKGSGDISRGMELPQPSVDPYSEIEDFGTPPLGRGL